MEGKERYEYYPKQNQLYDSEEDELYAYNLNNNKIISILNEQDKKIKDLEDKLADSEKQVKDARETGNMAVDSWCKNRRKYEAQTAEMQNKLFILYSMLYETLEKQGCDNVASQIAQMTGWTYDKEADWLKGNRNYDQLKQQLAEKDEEIAYLTKQVKKFNNEAQKYFEDAYCNDSIYQDKISFCIEQLEKVKETTECILDNALKNSSLNQSYYDRLLDEIDNQIKQLKVKAERS